MEQLLLLDQQLFLFINQLPHIAFTDGLAKFFSLIGSAGLVWFVLGGILFLKEEKKHPLFFAPIIIAGGVSYILVEWVLKLLVGRLRPTIEMGAIIVGNAKTDFSFPSGHATIAFAMATILSAYEQKFRGWFYGLAMLIGLSRIIVGVHYPLDVLGGGVLGWGIGVCIMRACKNLMPKSFGRRM